MDGGGVIWPECRISLCRGFGVEERYFRGDEPNSTESLSRLSDRRLFSGEILLRVGGRDEVADTLTAWLGATCIACVGFDAW